MAETNATIRITDAFSSTLDKLSSGLNKAQNGFQKLKSFGGQMDASGGGMFKSMLGANLVGSAVSKGMGLASAGVRSLYQTLNESDKSWQTFEGNMQQLGETPRVISKAQRSLEEFAKKSIYNPSEMASTYSQLKAVGTKNTLALVKGFGGLAASADDSKQAMKTLSQQATQMAAKPKATWEDFKLMIQQTPAGMSAVAKAMHTTTSGLVKDIQDGKVETSELFDAIAKVGNNKYFSKMATQYKTMDEAFGGLQETLVTNLREPFRKVSKVGIDLITDIADSLDKVNFDDLTDKLAGGLEKAISRGRQLLSQFIDGFNDSSFGSSVKKMFASIGDALDQVTGKMGRGGGLSMMTKLGTMIGNGLGVAARAVGGLARVIGQLNEDKIKAIASALLVLKFGLKGLVVGAAINQLSKLNNLNSAQLERVASALTKITVASAGLKVAAQSLNMLKGAIDTVSGLHDAFSKVKDGFTQISGGAGLTGFATNITQSITTGLSGIVTKVASIGPKLAAAFTGISGPVAAAIAVVTALIAGAVMAWQNNFMGFRDFVSNVFTGLFEPLKSAFSDLQGAFGGLLEPLKAAFESCAPVIEVFKTALMGLGVVAGAGVALGLAAIVDVISNFISSCAAAVNGAQALAHGLGALGNALKGDFSGMKNSFAEAGKALENMKANFSKSIRFEGTEKVIGSIGKMVSTLNGVKDKKVNISANVDVAGAQQKLNSLKAGKGAKIKIQPDVDVSAINRKMSAFGNKSAQLAKIKPNIDTAGVSRQISSAASKTNATAKIKTKADTSGLTSSLNKVTSGAGKSVTVKVKPKIEAGNIASQLNAKLSGLKSNAKVTITPKVNTAAVTAKLNSISSRTIPAPKIGTPKINTAAVNAQLSSITNRVLQGPRFSPRANLAGINAQLASITNRVIPAPRVARPNMSGVVSAVASGMNAAAAAARAGGAAISAAVSGAIQQAVAAAYAGAGQMQAAGAAIGAGLANGIRSQIGAVAAAADALVAQANRAARAAAQVHSPSRLFAEIGRYIGLGFAQGIDGTSQRVATAGRGLVNSATPRVYGNALTSRVGNPRTGLINGQGTTTTNNGGNNSVVIQSGAIVINSNGKIDDDVEELVGKIEDYLMQLKNKSLFGGG